MKQKIMDYFGFSKREYNGLLFLILLVLFVTIAPYLYKYYLRKLPIAGNEKEKLALQKLELVDRYVKRNYTNTRDAIGGPAIKPLVRYQTFNPNLITEKEWQQFGLSYKQAMSIVNYVKRGGKFYKPEDLKKMYTISPEKYKALLPYVSIPPPPNQYERKPYPKRESIVVEINTADTLELDKIRGIGPAFARRIVKYRERLGGFYSKEQLFEVFGVDTAKFNEIKDQVKINVEAIKKININTAEFDDLKRHPYLSFKQMNAIIQYRKQHGLYKNIADLNKVLILTPQTIQRIEPYLSF